MRKAKTPSFHTQEYDSNVIRISSRCKVVILYIGIYEIKTHFICNLILVSNVFNKIIYGPTSGIIEDMKNTQTISQENLKLQVLIPPQYLSIYLELMKFDTCHDTSRSLSYKIFDIAYNVLF